MDRKKLLDEGAKVTMKVYGIIRQLEPVVAHACLMSCMDSMIEEVSCRKREACLRLSRYYLEKSKEYKHEEGKDTEGSDRESEPLCESKAKRSRVKTAQAKVRKK